MTRVFESRVQSNESFAELPIAECAHSRRFVLPVVGAFERAFQARARRKPALSRAEKFRQASPMAERDTLKDFISFIQISTCEIMAEAPACTSDSLEYAKQLLPPFPAGANIAIVKNVVRLKRFPSGCFPSVFIIEIPKRGN